MFCYFWDIETSTIICDNSEEIQIVYLSNILKMNYLNGDIIESTFHRTLEEVVEYFKTLPPDTVVFSHNLDYELTFLLRELDNSNGVVKKNKNSIEVGIYGEIKQDIILRDKHSPLSIILSELDNITFRDTYAIFNKSVDQLGQEIGLEKLEYNYKEIRLPWDTLTEYDYKYNERDNIIVAKSIYKYMVDNNLEFKEIPLTFTSFVKQKRKNFIIDNFGKNSVTKFYYDKMEQYQNFDFFELMLKTFQGGLTASIMHETGKLIDKGLYSIDIKSSYPYQMCSRYFPYFSNNYVTHLHSGFADIEYKKCKNKGFFGTFEFENIRVKNKNYLLPISSSQISKGSVSSDRILFNGKLVSASNLVIPCNNIDIDTINLVYTYDKITCKEIITTQKARRLKIEEISFLLDSFNNKEKISEIKEKKGFLSEEESLRYNLSKVFINSMFGVKVTCPIKNSFRIIEGEIIEIDYFKHTIYDREEFYEKYSSEQNNFSGTIDLFSDGCYITSYGRYMLVEMMKKLVDNKCNVVYSDTDSIKFYLNGATEKEIFNIIDNENNRIIKDNKKNYRFTEYKEKFKVKEKDFNKICHLGIWEIENNGVPLPYFITFGAKKYGYIDNNNKVHTTIAGCNKKKPSIAIHNLAKKENIPLLDAFKIVFAIGTQFDESASGRTTAWSEKRSKEELDHYYYKGKKINQYGGIIIKETTYTLNISVNDSKLLNIDREDNYLIKIDIEGNISYE